jgi:NADH-quinone oxidoreductase subunit H
MSIVGQIALWGLIVGFIMTFVVITGFAYTTLLERIVLARLQSRVGPNRAGYIPLPRGKDGRERRFLGGIMQPAADAVKMFFKEDPTPDKVDKVTYNLAPMLTIIPAVVILAVIPWAGKIPGLGQPDWQYFAIAPGINVGVVFILAITSIAVYGIMLAGWASNSKYAILGGVRASAQMISYELALGIIVLIPIMLVDAPNPMDLGVIVEAQRDLWFVFRQPIAALIFYIVVLAELQRAPFDLLEAEQELSAGYSVEYAGLRFGTFFVAEYMKMISLSAIAVVFFFGGYRGPFVDQVPALGFLYMAGKIIISLFVMIWIRASLPRYRYDQLMSLGWKTLLPISVANFIIVAIFIVLQEEGVFNSLAEAIRTFFGF